MIRRIFLAFHFQQLWPSFCSLWFHDAMFLLLIWPDNLLLWYSYNSILQYLYPHSWYLLEVSNLYQPHLHQVYWVHLKHGKRINIWVNFHSFHVEQALLILLLFQWWCLISFSGTPDVTNKTFCNESPQTIWTAAGFTWKTLKTLMVVKCLNHKYYQLFTFLCFTLYHELFLALWFIAQFMDIIFGVNSFSSKSLF